jgi:Uma2 family endonuclease
MGLPDEKPRRATYADLAAVPANKVAEIIGGVLYIFPRPAPPNAFAASQLGDELGPFKQRHRKTRGPGGWIILPEPELHLGPTDDDDDVVPDFAGWRVERMAELPDAAYFTMIPDWVCEILSPSTEATDRAKKMPLYARVGVRHAWLVHPIARTLEVFVLNDARRWTLLDVHHGDVEVNAEPFEAVAIDLGEIWPTPTATDEAPG